MTRFSAAHVRLLPIAAAILLIAPSGVAGKSYGSWAPAVPETGVNTSAAEGCPIQWPDGLSLYIASNRAALLHPDPNDIWVFHRDSIDGSWSAAENLGQPVNSTAADYCPTPLRGKSLLFVSTRPGGCGAGATSTSAATTRPRAGASSTSDAQLTARFPTSPAASLVRRSSRRRRGRSCSSPATALRPVGPRTST